MIWRQVIFKGIVGEIVRRRENRIKGKEIWISKEKIIYKNKKNIHNIMGKWVKNIKIILYTFLVNLLIESKLKFRVNDMNKFLLFMYLFLIIIIYLTI